MHILSLDPLAMMITVFFFSLFTWLAPTDNSVGISDSPGNVLHETTSGFPKPGYPWATEFSMLSSVYHQGHFLPYLLPLTFENAPRYLLDSTSSATPTNTLRFTLRTVRNANAHLPAPPTLRFNPQLLTSVQPPILPYQNDVATTRERATGTKLHTDSYSNDTVILYRTKFTWCDTRSLTTIFISHTNPASYPRHQ